MLTLFSIPKPFIGETARLQRIALRSWAGLHSSVQVVVVGDDEGVCAAAAEIGVEHVGGVATGPTGAPLLDSVFASVDAVARYRLRCLVNADVVLLPDLLDAMGAVSDHWQRFLLVGQTIDLDQVDQAELEAPDALRRRALVDGEPRGVAAIDWFVFPVGLFDPIPPFTVGRAGFDNWLVWRTRREAPVVDASGAVVAIHQRHGYGHLVDGKREAYYGAEAARNVMLAGGRKHIYTLHDASHRMRPDLTVKRNPGAVLRIAETTRKVKWKLGLR